MSGSSILRYPIVHGYRLGEEIGGGGFSKVFRAFNDISGKVAACKVVNLFISPSIGYGTPNVKELQKEVQVHKSLSKHEYILEFIHSEVVVKEKEDDGWVPGLYMVLELAIGGDLFDKIAPDVGIPDDLANFYFAQMASGIEFIHQRGIAHRDLKPENLLLAANGNLKISDFGLCAVFKHKGKTRLLSGRCGSLPYVAPELGGPSGTGYRAEPVDIWGMGVVLYTMLFGNTPWDEPSDNSPEFRAYLTGELLQYEPWTRIRGSAMAMLLALLTVDPARRITMQQIKAHPWCMTSSQLTRAQMGDALTAGMRSTGMMTIADPTFASQASQAYAANRSQRIASGSQWASQLNPQESQFLRATGNITQGGDFNNITTRFWLSISCPDAVELLTSYLEADLGSNSVSAERRSNGADVKVQKAAGAKSVAGTFQIRGDDSLMEAKTMVVMRRGKGSILHWKAFWWSVVRDKRLLPYVVKGD
ncbi:kinase-like domain-containing protein [Kockovaella imperatae]|uniref:non-specific serine/threonine protein kinase n=1 Tax=Kockovaella imperatae TaxID=4999 RepID=A0A1Y1UHW2_9TREE|nr:kinase-like domain-containing protein [Kockovaella imperatae]ORX37650.1 kinase-like domain-containing protein [Kockovaella imperatae]